MHEDDSSIIERVRNGDSAAYRILVDRHKSKLFGMLMRLVGDRDQAEELAQDAFVKAFTSLHSYRGEAAFGTWLVQIGLHGARDRIRRLQRQRAHGIISLDDYLDRHPAGDAEPVAAGAGPLEALDRKEVAERLEEALADLPPTYREVFVMKHVEGWSYEDIAATTGDSVGSLKVRAHRARRLLREALANTDVEPDIANIMPRRED